MELLRQGGVLMSGVLLRRRWMVGSELGRERAVVLGLERALRSVRLTESRLEEIVTAASEACLNAIEHGNRFVRETPIRVTLAVRPDRCTLRVFDRGAGMSPNHTPPCSTVREKIAWDEPRGWGLQLMREYADELRFYETDGRFCVEMQFLTVIGAAPGGESGAEHT